MVMVVLYGNSYGSSDVKTTTWEEGLINTEACYGSTPG